MTSTRDAMTHGTSRRGFLGGLGGLLLAFWALPTRAADKLKKVALSLTKVEKLGKVGGWAILKIKERNVLLVRDTESTVRALDPTCSHEKCTVGFEPKDGRVHCPCHKSTYDLDGKVLEGPAPKPLTVFPAALEGDRIILSLPAD